MSSYSRGSSMRSTSNNRAKTPGNQFYEDPSDPRVQERNRNRKLLAELNDKYHRFEGDCEAELSKMQTVYADMRSTWAQEHSQLKDQLEQVAHEKAALRSNIQIMAHEKVAVQKELQNLAQQKATLQEDVMGLRGEMEEMRHECKRLMMQARQQDGTQGVIGNELQDIKSQCQRELMQMNNEFQQMKTKCQRDFTQMTSRMTDLDKQAIELRKGLQSSNELVRMESRVGLVMNSLQDLTKQLWDRGVLLPPKPEAPPEEDKPPVGTIELDEDVFTARLMLKLGFMRADAESRKHGNSDDESDWDSDLEEGLSLSVFDNVQGLMLPAVEKGGKGYFAATYGWLSVCITTSFVQWLILGIMLTHGLQSNQCYEHSPTAFKWWLLHMSKALAMFITGIMMGKELVGLLNYFLVSELLESRKSFEAVCTTLVQGGLTILLVTANVFIFLGLTNPVDVWTNMAGLGFIANLDAEVLAAAKCGMLGHNVAKNLTPLNYQLSFVSHYPTWFGYVKAIAVMVVVAFIACFAGLVFVMPDPICSA